MKRKITALFACFLLATGCSYAFSINPAQSAINYVAKKAIYSIPPVKRALNKTGEALRINEAKAAVNEKFKIDEKTQKVDETLKITETKEKVADFVKYEENKTKVANFINFEEKKEKTMKFIHSKKKKTGKKTKKKEPKMVATVDEWHKEAQCVPLEDREVPAYKAPINEKLTKVEPPKTSLVPYNVPPGTQDVDLSGIKKNLTMRSQGVASPDFKNLVYTQYFYAPNENQISSEALVVPLDRSEGRLNRVLKAHVIRTKRQEHPEGGTEYFLRNLQNIFVTVDWSEDSKTVLLKEKVGSSNGGVYRTYAWLMRVNDDGKMTYFRCDEIQEVISRYWGTRDLALDTYRWDITPLGWDASNPDRAIILAWAYQKDKSRVFLGAWGYNRQYRNVELLSLTKKEFDIRANGRIVEFKLF